jgi:hypothetical protein
MSYMRVSTFRLLESEHYQTPLYLTINVFNIRKLLV